MGGSNLHPPSPTLRGFRAGRANKPSFSVGDISSVELLALALGNRIQHSTADKTSLGRGCLWLEKGAASASPRVASIPLGPAKSSFLSPAHLSKAACCFCSLCACGLPATLGPQARPIEFCSAGFRGAALFPHAAQAVTRGRVSFGLSGAQLRRVWHCAEGTGGEAWRRGCSRPPVRLGASHFSFPGLSFSD